MPLPSPKLDDRTFQSLVDDAKRRIPLYCPEWTDHNVSDPGIMLVELFAWMTELMLYRTNQVPEKMYRRFLDMLGVELAPPRAAQVELTFYLSAAQPTEVKIPRDTEVATPRTETSQAIVFSTERALTIHVARLIAIQTKQTDAHGIPRRESHDLTALSLGLSQVEVFASTPQIGDALYVGFQEDLSHHVIALILGCIDAAGEGSRPTEPPWQWEVLSKSASGETWIPCVVEHDGTLGMNQSGELILRLPSMVSGDRSGTTAWWLRCRLTDEQAMEQKRYLKSPRLTQMSVESRGGSVSARHCITVRDEILGTSAGAAGQSFQLLHFPILQRDRSRDWLCVQSPDGKEEVWQEVEDFADSLPTSRHFRLESATGILSLGPSLLQPDGKICHFGATPPKGSRLRFSSYQYGGGIDGNVPAKSIRVLKSSVAYVSRVSNHERATGGGNAQSLEDAKFRAAQLLRHQRRAVTRDDYEYVAQNVKGVARALCVGAGTPSGSKDAAPRGTVLLYILPELKTVSPGNEALQLEEGMLHLQADLETAVRSALDKCRVLGSLVDIKSLFVTWVSIEVRARLSKREGSESPQAVEAAIKLAIAKFVNPHIGGRAGTGWDFGRPLYESELYMLVQAIPSVDSVEQISLSANGQASPRQIVIPPHGVVCTRLSSIRVNWIAA